MDMGGHTARKLLLRSHWERLKLQEGLLRGISKFCVLSFRFRYEVRELMCEQC